MQVIFVVTGHVQGDVHIDAVEVGQEATVTVAAGVAAVGVVAAAVVQKRREVAVEPGEVAHGARTSQREVDRALTVGQGGVDQVAARNLRGTGQTVVKSARGVAQIVATDQRRVHQGVLRSQKGAVLEAAMTARKVALQARKSLPRVVLQVARSHAEVDREVPRVQRKAARLVATSLSSLVRMAGRVAVVRQAETESQTEKTKMMRQNLHTRGATAALVVQLNQSLLTEVVLLVVKLVASLLLVRWVIRMRSILRNVARIVKKQQEVVAGHQGMTKTWTEPIHMNRKVFQHVNIRVGVGQPVRRGRVVIGPSLEVQRKLKAEVVLAVVAKISVEVVQEIAARPGALHQVQAVAESEVVASQPSVISQRVVLQVLQRPRLIVAHRAVRKIRDGAVLLFVTRMVAELSREAQRERNLEAVRRKNLTAAIKLAKVAHAVRLVHAAGQHHVRRLVGKVTRNLAENLLNNTEVCILLPRIMTE